MEESADTNLGESQANPQEVPLPPPIPPSSPLQSASTYSEASLAAAEQLPPDLQQITTLIRQAAQNRQRDSRALLHLLRELEALHQDIRETLFRESLPTSRHHLYRLLRDVEVNGGWPYIQRMKLRALLGAMLDEEQDPST